MYQSHTNQEDQQIWRGTVTGVFSVRSAYHIEKDRELAAKVGGSTRDRNSHIWRSIWKLSISSAEFFFLWRACKNILPTRDNLCRRKILLDPLCPLCEQEVETTFHILWQCISARDVWGFGSVIFQKSCYNKPDFFACYRRYDNKMQHPGVSAICRSSKKTLAQAKYLHS
jgi:hypothetical protein